MINIKTIIAKHKTQLEAAGLLRQVQSAQQSERVKKMRPSLRKVTTALEENPDLLRAQVQQSPMAVLFEVVLPKIEELLIELGEEKAEEIVGALCQHGRETIEEHGVDGAREHLEGLFRDLPDFEAKLRKKNGIDWIIEAYRKLAFESEESYLKFVLGEKIDEIYLWSDDGKLLSLGLEAFTKDQDLFYLRKLKHLTTLRLWKTQVSDVTPLRSLTSLQDLGLEGTQVSDITPLSGLISLQELHLEGTRVSDVTPLRNLTSLLELYLGGTQVSDVAPLRSLTNLKRLSLGETEVSDVTPLRSLTNLESLFLGETQVSDVAPLRSLASMKRLSLGQTQVSDITPLSGLISLQKLDLWRTQVSDVVPLRSLTSLRYLNLMATQVSDITPLSGLTSLQRLNLKWTQVSDTQVKELKKAIPGLEIER